MTTHTKLRYIGPHLAVRLPWPNGGEAVVEHGQVVETTSDHAERLLEQVLNWEPATPAVKKRSAKAEKDGD